MLLDVVILPPAKLLGKIGKKITEAVRGMSAVFVADNQKLISRISLFHIRIKKNRLEKLSQKVQEVIKKHRQFIMKSTGTFLEPKTEWIIWFSLNNSAAFIKLHREIVESCYRFRTGMMPFNPERILRLKKAHTTLAKLKNREDAESAFRELQNVKFSFRVNEVAITEVNFWHQVTRVIKRFKFGR